MDYKKMSSFSRTSANERKMGAYYTDLDHAKRLGRLFKFPDDEVAMLEPSIGDASAAIAFSGNNNVKIFGCDINPSENLKEIPYFIKGDFLNGVKISHSAFSLCFANPPYGLHETKRLEQLFIEKIFHYLNNKGILVLIIPSYVLLENEAFQKSFFARFEPQAVYKFDDEIYKQFKQLAVIARKRHGIGYLKKDFDNYFQNLSLATFPYLPKEGEKVEQYSVSPSHAANVEYFTTLEFDRKTAGMNLSHSVLYDELNKRLRIPSFVATELGNPPMPLKKDLLYLIAIAGGGQGRVGSVTTLDAHLQRGCANVVTSTETREVDGKTVLVEKNFTKISLTIIENSGEITVLE